MIAWLLYRILFLATILALLGGTTLQATPGDHLTGKDAWRAGSVAETICDVSNDMMTSMADDPPDQSPCDSTTDDGIKQIDGSDALSFPGTSLLGTRLTYATVRYWTVLLPLGGLSHKPDLFPPISR